MRMRNMAVLALLLPVAACAGMADQDGAAVPGGLAGKVRVLSPDDPAYGRAVAAKAVKPAGQGGVTRALVVQATADITVYRMWNGPAKLDANGNTNRLGAWWAADRPIGTAEGYRRAYEICGTWNDLTWVATCTLKTGAVVAVGPGQSVAAATCGDASGHETYDVNQVDWQIYVDSPWKRPDELACPPVSADYRANPADVTEKTAN